MQLRRLVLVMLVFDVADDRFHHVLDRHQPIGPAVLVDDQRHMRAGRLHLEQQVERRHRRRRIENGPQDFCRRERHVEPRLAVAVGRLLMARLHEPEARIGGEKNDEVADVDHAARIVERLVIDRQARVAGGAEAIEHFPQRRVERKRDDVGARHHHVLDPHVVQREHVFEDGALLGSELLARALLDRVFNVVARRRGRQSEQRPHPLKQARRLLPRNAYRRRFRRRSDLVCHGHPPINSRA